MRMRALIVDDEPLARAALWGFAKRDSDLNVVAECSDGESAVRTILQLQPDLVFLDVQMPEMTGFEVVESVGVEGMPITIFVTAFDRYAIRAFDANAIDYLLKPFAADRFSRAVTRARHRWQGMRDSEAAERLFSLLGSRHQSDYVQRLTVVNKGRVSFVSVADIDWIEAEGNYARLHVNGHIFDVRETLQSLTEKLDPLEFIRIHRSTIVNLLRVRQVQTWFHGTHIVLLLNGEKLRMSRYQREAVERLLGKKQGAANRDRAVLQVDFRKNKGQLDG